MGCLTSLNFLITVWNLRSCSLTCNTMPLFPWAIFLTAVMLIFTLPVLTGGLLMVLADLHSNTVFFDPVFGVISIVISGIAQKVIFGNQSMILAMSCISVLGSLVWGHHMYTVGLESDTRAYFTAVTMLISLPTG